MGEPCVDEDVVEGGLEANHQGVKSLIMSQKSGFGRTMAKKKQYQSLLVRSQASRYWWQLLLPCRSSKQ